MHNSMIPSTKLTRLYLLGILALGFSVVDAWTQSPGPIRPVPSTKWLGTRDNDQYTNSTGSIAAYDRYCPWCWGNLQIPENPGNKTRHCNLVVQRPVDASRPLSEYIDLAVLSHDFKELRGMQLRVPWGVPTNITFGLVELYGNGTSQITVMTPTTSSSSGTGTVTGTGTSRGTVTTPTTSSSSGTSTGTGTGTGTSPITVTTPTTSSSSSTNTVTGTGTGRGTVTTPTTSTSSGTSTLTGTGTSPVMVTIPTPMTSSSDTSTAAKTGTMTGATTTDSADGALHFYYSKVRGIDELHYLPGDERWNGPVHHVDPNYRYVIYHLLFQCMPSS